MSRLISSAFQIRQDPRLLKAPPYISFGCLLVGVAWLLLLPLNDYSRRTYISENALLPGQVHTYFSGSDQHVFRAYKRELKELAEEDNHVVNDRLEKIALDIGLKTARQNFTYTSSGETYTGENLYGILQAPRGDATEAIVLIASWRNADGALNIHGVPLALTLARYFKRWSLWSKDIILLFPPEPTMGSQAWADAYHDAHNTETIGSLPMKSGLLQGAIAIDYAKEDRFHSVHIAYDGVNGQLPNLDLVNSIVSISGGQMGFLSNIQRMWNHEDSYEERLQTMFRGMVNQGLGHATGPHSAFIPYHVDAVTLTPYGAGWQDEMAMGRLIEASFRSLNNLLEHLHQSFFFYLLMNRDRFVSIGTYLPSAMVLAANFTIMAIACWVKSGQVDDGDRKRRRKREEKLDARDRRKREEKRDDKSDSRERRKREEKSEIRERRRREDKTESGERRKLEPTALTATSSLLSVSSSASASSSHATPSTTSSSHAPVYRERKIAFGLVFVLATHILGLIPLYTLNHAPANLLSGAFFGLTGLTYILPFVISRIASSVRPHIQEFQLTKSCSLLFLGMILSALATFNFSQAFFIGLFSAPFSYAYPLGHKLKCMLPFYVILSVLSPPSILIIGSVVSSNDLSDLLKEVAFGYNVWGMYTSVIVWCLWWPAWLVASAIVVSKPSPSSSSSRR